MGESYHPNKPSRRFRSPSNPWIPYVGDCKAVNNYLESKQGIGWLFPKFLNSFFRGFSQVLFANNPLTGLIILLALSWADPLVGLAAAVSATFAIITALLLKQELRHIQSGLTTFNAVLIGSVTVSLWSPTFGVAVPLKLWVFIILGAIFSVFITSALTNLFSSYKLTLPCLTFPFNIVALLLFTCLMPPIGPTGPGTGGEIEVSSMATPGLNTTSTELSRQVRETSGEVTDITQMSDDPEVSVELSVTEPTFISDVGTGSNETAEIDAYDEDEEEPDPNAVNWGHMLNGILLSMGQVFGINDLFASILIYIAVMVYSPVMCLVSIVGAILGTIGGLLFTSAPYTAVYTGLWGFNGILSAAAVGGYFIAMTCHSFWTAIANVLFTVVIQQALMVAFHSLRLPVFTLPFVLSTLLFLSVSASGEQFPRVTNFSFPELHRYEYLERRRLNRINRNMQDEALHPEEKELVLKDIKVIGDEPTELGGNGTSSGGITEK
ncbi:unnamed protein product [Allacma fusca]|uniref:Urea transporter n=1 Tax=Allacma fusca TaxID=39272 RepID=A0A8J2JDH4_9HEXA|nr:unnamed protein product [Allacma fusca]